jgi:hypothetical protein
LSGEAASSQEGIVRFPEEKTIVYGSKKRFRRTLDTSASWIHLGEVDPDRL